MNRSLSLLAILVMMVSGCARTLEVSNLRCDASQQPLGVDDRHPALGWVLESPNRGERQSAYQILVASSPDNIAGNVGDVWDSGKVRSDASVDIEYNGRPLEAGKKYWWKVRAWDRYGEPSDWSLPATWTQGLMEEGDWHGAQWIAARTLSPLTVSARNGYHAAESHDQNEEKWVQVDLGKPVPIDMVTLVPADPNNYQPNTPGFGFPVRFKIQASDNPNFTKYTTVVDQTIADYPSPKNAEQRFDSPAVTARYVRVMGTKNWIRKDGVACFALAEMEVLSAGKNVALHRPASAKDSVEAAGWGLAGLTDGYVAADVLAEEYAAPLLRKNFLTEHKHIRRAIATICGLGYYELYLNGKKVGDRVLDPGFTDFSKRALYSTYDVSEQLGDGPNTVGVILGGGWYELATPDLFGDEHAPWTAPPKVRMQLDVTYSDGSHQMIRTDDSWRWSTGEITFQGLRAGETHDMRREQRGWATPVFDDHKWKTVRVVDGPAGRLVSQRQPAIKNEGEIPAVEMTEPKPGVYVYKLAENTAGWARFTTSGEAGEKITLRFGETLKANGTIATFLSSHTYGRWQTGEFILAGQGKETYEPRFCYHGFQYVEIEGASRRPMLGDLVGVRVHTALDVAGHFSCSDELINRIQQVILRTYLNNLQSIPTDCPQREKMGWMCDGMVASNQAMVNFDARTTYEKWVGDMADAQDEDGSMPAIVPTQGWSKTGHPGQDFQCPWWGGATVVVPWNLYQTYGDVRILKEHYEAMRRYVDSLTARATDGIVTFGLGDWLEVGREHEGRPVRTPTELTSTAGYAYFADLVSKTAALLGKGDDAEKYGKLSRDVREAFNKKYLRADGKYGDDTQTAPALALVLGLVPDDRKEEVAKGLVENIESRHDHLSTGLLGTLYLFKALEQIGREDLAWKIATQTDFPSWGNMLNHDATTLWESWDGTGSHDHPALGSGGIWFYTSLAGIRPAAPGYKKIVIKPAMIQGLKWVKADQETPYGVIRSQWHKDARGLKMEVSIPVNTTAMVYVPAKRAQSVMEGGGPTANAGGVRLVRMESGFAVYQVGSGEYSFTVN